VETEDSALISPREAQVMSLLDEIGDALKQKGLTLEELLESGQEIREEIYQEKYADSDGP
jgi:hypothetical protein